MASRKPHRKSRTGCAPCKKRHIKCGEERPSCCNCVDSDLQCQYLTATSRSQSLAASASSNQCSPMDSAVVALGSTVRVGNVGHGEELNTSDMELLHHYSTVTYLSMSNVPEEQRLWQSTVIKIALQHTFLLRGILAHSALHLSYLNSTPHSIGYLVKASTHQDIALSQFRKTFDSINPTNFDSVLCFSFLLPVHYIAIASSSTFNTQAQPQALTYTQNEAQNQQIEQDNLSALLKAVQLCRSVNKLLLPWLADVNGSSILPLLQVTRQNLAEASTYPGIESLGLLEAACSTFSTSTSASINYHRRVVCYEAIAHLRTTFARVANTRRDEQFTIGVMLLWTTVISDDYMTALDERHPSAMAIFAHFAALLHGGDDVWWLRGLSSSLIQIISAALGDEWSHVLSWPRMVVGLA